MYFFIQPQKAEPKNSTVFMHKHFIAYDEWEWL
jgi:hypothetical protein